MPKYLNLSIGAKVRLAILKRDCEQWYVKNPHDTRDRVLSWRNMRYATFKNMDSGLSRGLDSGNPVWYCHSGPQFRNEKDCHDIYKRIGHTGWYCDVHQEGKAIGIVASLPHGRFIAGYRLTENDERVYFPSVFNDEYVAASMADEHARVIAESEREQSERYRDASDLRYEIETKQSRLLECLALRHHKCFPQMRETARMLIEQIKDMKNTLDTEYKGVF